MLEAEGAAAVLGAGVVAGSAAAAAVMGIAESNNPLYVNCGDSVHHTTVRGFDANVSTDVP